MAPRRIGECAEADLRGVLVLRRSLASPVSQCGAPGRAWEGIVRVDIDNCAQEGLDSSSNM